MTAAYDRMHARAERLGRIAEAQAVLHWDMAAMMPDGGMAARGEQLAALAALHHGMLTAPETADAIAQAETEAGAESGGSGPDDWRRANIREFKRRREAAAALPEDLVEALSRASTACESAWRAAKPAADFKAVLPAMETLVRLTREAAEARGAALNLSPYDAMLEQYDPGAREADFAPVFARLERELPPLLEDVLEHQARAPAPRAPAGPFPRAAQKALGETLMGALGFDFAHGRLDESRHPFCGGTPDDVRITTRYDEADFTKALMGVLHETGHAMYERGLPEAWRGQPAGEALGMTMHESQSLLVEMQLCRSRPFLEFARPHMAAAFGLKGAAAESGSWSLENLERLYRRVGRGFIRVDADEVTYPLHVILRWRLEKALIEGALAPADLPGAWNEGMAGLLGVTPPDDAEGCLQDIHWYDGAYGYFPTYTLGALAAAQIFAAVREALPGLDDDVRAGNFAPLFAWLREHIHGRGSLHSTPETITAATGAPLSETAFLAHLKARYLGE
ncbi:MAG: carboxypeptidase M32 [Rhodospirillales bacterium]